MEDMIFPKLSFYFHYYFGLAFEGACYLTNRLSIALSLSQLHGMNSPNPLKLTRIIQNLLPLATSTHVLRGLFKLLDYCVQMSSINAHSSHI